MERTIVTLADGRDLDVVAVGEPGRPVVCFLHGTPGGPLETLGAAEAAESAKVRLIAAGRPGYADSTPLPRPGLGQVADDLIELADRWRIERFGVLGVSGGGPYALVTALIGGDRVTRLGLLAGAGPWELIDPDEPDTAVEREAIATAASGDLARASAMLEAEIAPFIEMVRTSPPAPMPASVAAAIVDGARNGLGGYARDVLSQGLPWGLDPAAVAIETRLVYGESDRNVPAAHGRWYAERIRGSILEIVPGADHPATIGGGYPAMLAFLAGD